MALISSLSLTAQTIPMNIPQQLDVARRNQIIGISSSNISFMVRPVTLDSSSYTIKKTDIIILPLIWNNQYNSDHPEGLNDGSMIPSRGFQTYMSTGVYAKAGLISLQIMPEWVFAENRNFMQFPAELSNNYWEVYNQYIWKSTDLPQRFGSSSYSRLFWGQSRLSLEWSSLALTISTENIWWGPGVKSSLLMTNNAPGFPHVSLHTVKPIKTFLGSFEGQYISGRLDASGFLSVDTNMLAEHGIKYISKVEDWRYLNGMVFSFQPRFIPGLFLGAARSFMCYHNDLGKKLGNYIPVLTPLLKIAVNNNLEDQIPRDQLASVFARWIAPESHMEVYAEFGREDHSYDLNDLVQELEHSAAYILGFRKMTLVGRNSFLDFQTEIIHMSKNPTTLYRSTDASGWYNHYQVTDGYTNQGQILGAGIGTSSNMQWGSLAWVHGYKKIGLEFKRLVHEENFWAYTIKDYRKHWVDLGGAVVTEWDYKNFLINARLETIGSINYQHLYAPIPSDPPQWWDHGPIRYNVHAELGITYLFNRSFYE